MKNDRTITVIGAGYVGLTTAVLLAESGFRVYLLEINQERLSIIKKGRSFFYEAGIDSLVEHAVKTGKLLPTDSYEESVPKSNFVFSCVGTPDNPDGSSNLSYVFASAKEAGKYMDDGSIYIQKSTVPVGTGEKVEQIFQATGKEIAYVSNPEFLREGTAIADSLWFDRIVVGGVDSKAVDKVMGLYREIEKHSREIASRAKLKTPPNHEGIYIATNRNSAELIKVTANAFLALKISFANSIAKLADHTDANITEVMDAVGADNRIGHAFLNAGRGYGGGCFPKDVSGLISSATEHGVELGIMTAASDLNETMPGYIANKAKDSLGELKGKKVAVLGLAFKAGTSDARKSPGVKLSNILGRSQAEVSVYDPQANGEARAELRKGVNICDSVQAAVKNADAVFVATDWPEFLQVDLKKIKKLMRGNLFVDAVNAFDTAKIRKAGFIYSGVGR